MKKYLVRWRYIPIELRMTPYMMIPVEHTEVESEKGTDWDIEIEIAKKFDWIRPDDVRIESKDLLDTRANLGRAYDGVNHWKQLAENQQSEITRLRGLIGRCKELIIAMESRPVKLTEIDSLLREIETLNLTERCHTSQY